MKHFLSVIAYKSAYGIIYTVSMIPLSFLYAAASLLYLFVYYITGYRKAVVIQNISRSFPEKNYVEVITIVRKFYICFAAYFAEMIKSVSTSPLKLDKRLTFVNLELIDKYIYQGKNVIVSLGHCGNWEMLNFMPYKLHHDIYAIYKPLRSETANKIMIKMRSRFGMNLISDKSVSRHILTKRASSSVYLFLADQCPRSKEEKYRFNLLNQTTYFFSGMEKLARISQSAVVYLHITQPSKGHYIITCKSLWDGIKIAEEGEITREYVNLLTENIREEPHGWLWSHKRWKR